MYGGINSLKKDAVISIGSYMINLLQKQNPILSSLFSEHGGSR